MARSFVLAAAVLFALPLAGCRTAGPSGGAGSPRVAGMEAAAAVHSPWVGKRAPAFELSNDFGKTVSLADYAGKWVVLYFYPQDDTPGCACQATEFTTLLIQFKDMNAAVLGVSPDDPASHRKFRDKYDLKLGLLSDPEHEAMSRYGAWHEVSVDGQTTGRVLRTTFLIDPQGRIAWHWPEVIPEGHAERVRQKLAELRAAVGRR